LGQANYGGAIHFFSPQVADTFGVSQKVTYGSFDTRALVTRVQTGEIAALAGTRILLNFDERQSNGELSNSGGIAFNQLFKSYTPLGTHASLTLFAAHNYTRFFQSDAGPGETWAQVLAYGKNFALTTDPTSEFYKGFNTQKKQTDFEYADFRDDFRNGEGRGFSVEDQGYTYFYSNKTISVDAVTGLIGGPNTSPPAQKTLPRTDIGGYNKGNRYRVYGDILRVNDDFGFGVLKAGALVEGSSTDRHNILYDLTTGVPDLKYASFPPAPPAKNVSNIKTLELSNWFQYQLFADLELRPLANLTVTPGFKYVNLTRTVNAAVENSGAPNFPRGSVMGSNTYDKPLYFLTANYKIRPDLSVYGQYATGFLIPSLSTLQVANLSLNQLKPQQSINYQGGFVFSHGHMTADADLYLIDVSNLAVPDPTGQFYVNAGSARYSGVEGEAAYAFDFGLTLFANGSRGTAKSITAGTELTNAPKWTDAFGALYDYHHVQASLTYKEVGAQVAFYAPSALVTPDGLSLAANQAREIKAYNTLNASLGYDFGNFKVKLAAFNLADRRALISLTGPTATDLYEFQAGRQVLVTLEARLP
ncbi:MAG: TonB-dependent receptor, partial [Caulobacteraceae bacterium]|nr:TonB-dependent receptor [Caulobacteraceae bacterium]